MNNLNVAKIQLNGSSYEISNGTNLNELLNKLKIQKNKVAIEVCVYPAALIIIPLKEPLAFCIIVTISPSIFD